MAKVEPDGKKAKRFIQQIEAHPYKGELVVNHFNPVESWKLTREEAFVFAAELSRKADEILRQAMALPRYRDADHKRCDTCGAHYPLDYTGQCTNKAPLCTKSKIM